MGLKLVLIALFVSHLGLLVLSCTPTIKDPCLLDPTLRNCSIYKLPGVYNFLNESCSMMKTMPSCTVFQICKDHAQSSGEYCQDFGIFKEFCNDMGAMGLCQDLSCECPTDSLILECSIKTLPLPTSSEMQSLIKKMCDTSSPMAECEPCTTHQYNCDLLSVYSNLCSAMPSMSPCALFFQICDLVPSWPICPSNSDTPPMRMYFHLGIMDYILVKDWVPRNYVSYIGSIIAVFLLSVLYEFLKMFRARCEKAWASPRFSLNTSSEDMHLIMKNQVNPPFRLKVDLPRAILHFLEVGIGFLLMLIAMTFNVGLFLTVCVGAGFGSLLFHRFAVYEYVSKSCH